MKFTKLAAAATLALAFSAAQAATATNTFNVKINITGTCNATAFSGITVSDVIFTAMTATATSVEQQATNNAGTKLAVSCSKNLPVTVGLLPSNANASGAGTMTAVLPALGTIAYQLRKPDATLAPVYSPAYTVNWGNAGADLLSVTGTGLANTINIPVQATIAANLLDVAAGAYTDAVTATLTY